MCGRGSRRGRIVVQFGRSACLRKSSPRGVFAKPEGGSKGGPQTGGTRGRTWAVQIPGKSCHSGGLRYRFGYAAATPRPKPP